MFEKSLFDFIQMRKEGIIDNIYFSTWKGEIQQCPDVMEFFKKWKIILIEEDEPKDRGEGNIWCQMKSLDQGLEKIPKDSFVLKTRTDIYINPEFLKKLFENKNRLLKIKDHLPKGDIFHYKVWIPSCDLKTPFYMEDICFFGFHPDMGKLYNYNPYYDNVGMPKSKVHIRRFAEPFLKDYPFFRELFKETTSQGLIHETLRKFSNKYLDLRKIKGLLTLNKLKKETKIKKLLDDKKYIRNLAAYIYILHSHFYIDSTTKKRQIILKQKHEKQVPLDNFDIKNNFSTEKMTDDRVMVVNNNILDNIVHKNIKKDKFTIRLLSAIDEFKNLK